MKKYLICLLILLKVSHCFAQEAETEVFKKKSSEYPQFKYDRQEFDSLIFWNKQMTVAALNGYYSAKAIVSFTVDTVGLLKNVSISDFEMQKIPGYFTLKETPEQEKQISNDLKSESIRVISITSGLWKPAIKDGKPIEKRMFTTILFSATFERKIGPDNFAKKDEKIGVVTISNSYLIKPNEGFKQSQLYNVAERRMKANKPELAAIYYLQAVRYNENRIANTPDNIDAYYDMGICYSKLGDMSRACKCWKACYNMGDTSVQNLLDKYCK